MCSYAYCFVTGKKFSNFPWHTLIGIFFPFAEQYRIKWKSYIPERYWLHKKAKEKKKEAFLSCLKKYQQT